MGPGWLLDQHGCVLRGQRENVSDRPVPVRYWVGERTLLCVLGDYIFLDLERTKSFLKITNQLPKLFRASDGFTPRPRYIHCFPRLDGQACVVQHSPARFTSIAHGLPSSCLSQSGAEAAEGGMLTPLERVYELWRVREAVASW